MFSIHSMVACQEPFFGAISHVGYKRVTIILTTNRMNLILFVAVEFRN